uniref:Variant surface glycoprotein 1125.1123 n=1 Tax=Trypanosoma brucei TaxID=5691 RepID=A0A1J0R699_9TRYP|nr:variant surface glycoprotein 1125.1123 [Trypanosoma brucei]
MGQKTRSVAIVAVIELMSWALNAQSAVNAGDNSGEFAELCALVALADAKPSPPADTGKADAEYDEIQRLNMSLSGESWQSMFSDKGEKKTWLTTIPTAIKDPGDWAEQWPDWQKAMEETTKPALMEDINKAGFSTLKGLQKAAVTSQARRLAMAARELRKKRLKLKTELATPTDQQTKEELNDAVYGVKSTEKQTAALATAIEGGAANYNTVCTGTGAEIKAKTVAAALACICCNAEASNAAQVCGTSVKLTNQWTVASNLVLNDLTQPLSFCPRHQKKTVTASDIEGPLTKLQNLIRVKSGAATLGATEDGSCTGKTDGGICIKITDWGSDGSKTIANGLPWAKKLNDLMINIQKREKAVAAAHTIDEEIKAVHKKLFALPGTTGAYSEINTAGAGVAAQTTTQSQKSGQEGSADCTTHKDNKTACEKTGKCQWKGGESDTKGDCKPKEGQEQTNTSAGKKEEKCKGKLEDDCK